MEVKQVFPLFEEGRILKKDSLDLLRDYAPEFFSLLFCEYGNGIVAGFEIRQAGERITVSPGIMKDGSSFLCMKEEAVLDYDMYGQTTQVALRREGCSSTPDYRTECYGLFLGAVRTLGEGEYELGRFSLEKGARLRTGEYKDFHDLATEFNTLNRIHVRYACEQGSTLAPQIMKLYGTGVLASQKAEPLDLSFASACLSNPRIPVQFIRDYLYARERTREPDGGIPNLYARLGRLYSRLVSGGEYRQRQKGAGGKTVID